VIIVCDSSPLIFLFSGDRIDRLGSLLGTVIIPPAVREEVFGASTGRALSMPDFIHVADTSTETAVRFLQMSLHAGEREAIALELNRGIERIILDDKQARETADRLGLRVIGTIGLLILAKDKGLIIEARPLIIQMMDRINFRIAPAVLNRALAHLNEPPL